MPNKIKVLMVCHGNICRSTMAESVFTHLVKTRNIDPDKLMDHAPELKSGFRENREKRKKRFEN